MLFIQKPWDTDTSTVRVISDSWTCQCNKCS